MEEKALTDRIQELELQIQELEKQFQKVVGDRNGWKEAWCDQRDATGRAYWSGYKHGYAQGLTGKPAYGIGVQPKEETK